MARKRNPEEKRSPDHPPAPSDRPDYGAMVDWLIRDLPVGPLPTQEDQPEG